VLSRLAPLIPLSLLHSGALGSAFGDGSGLTVLPFPGSVTPSADLARAYFFLFSLFVESSLNFSSVEEANSPCVRVPDKTPTCRLREAGCEGFCVPPRSTCRTCLNMRLGSYPLSQRFSRVDGYGLLNRIFSLKSNRRSNRFEQHPLPSFWAHFFNLTCASSQYRNTPLSRCFPASPVPS